MSEETSSSSTGMDSSDSTAAKPTKSGPNRGLLIGGLIAVVVIAGVVVSTNGSDAPRSGTAAECKDSGINCTVGDIGPGGGKVFSLGGKTAPATCTGTCLEVAPLGWQATPAATTDLSSNWSTAKSTAATYAAGTAAAGTWRLPNQTEITTLAQLSATDPAKANGFRDASSSYWTNVQVGYVAGLHPYECVYVKKLTTTVSCTGSLTPTSGSAYSRPIHPF